MYHVVKHISISITHSDHTDLVGFLHGGRVGAMGLLSYSGCVEKCNQLVVFRSQFLRLG